MAAPKRAFGGALHSIYMLCFWAFGLRIVLIMYGEWHDNNMELKYTDIDYSVFSGAARYVLKGESPFRRATYRYTPLIAYAVVPNFLIHPAFGKVLFSALDSVTGVLIYAILRQRGFSLAAAIVCSSAWLFNPLPLVVSTRGNAESVLSCLVLASLLLLVQRRTLIAAVLFGVAVHVKTYPIIYAPSVYLLLNIEEIRREKRAGRGRGGETRVGRWISLLTPKKDSFLFGVTSIGVAAGLTGLFYVWYGEEFLDETLWYHVGRRDTQHNFSIYFYPLKLAEKVGGWLPSVVGLAAFLPQSLATCLLSGKYFQDLPFAWFMITAAFVTFNKVCTSQYFIWYLCLLPLILPLIKMSKREAMGLFALWLSAQGVWFAPAYCYEYLKWDVLGYVWIASLYFFWINILCLWRIASHYLYCPLFNPATGTLKPVALQWELALSKKAK